MQPEDILINTLESFGFPVRLQGSLQANEPYPESFFTFWQPDSSDGSYFDNEEHQTEFDFNVYLYSTAPDLVYTYIRQAKAALKLAGFIVSGDGYSVQSDEETHDGRGINVIYLRRN